MLLLNINRYAGHYNEELRSSSMLIVNDYLIVSFPDCLCNSCARRRINSFEGASY